MNNNIKSTTIYKRGKKKKEVIHGLFLRLLLIKHVLKFASIIVILYTLLFFKIIIKKKNIYRKEKNVYCHVWL
jgi:hypothetical protein